MFINALENLKQNTENENSFVAIDLHLARYVYEQSLHSDEAVKINLACTCLALYQAQQRGHSALPLDMALREVNKLLEQLKINSFTDFQSIDEWQDKLVASQWLCELENINQPCNKALAIIPAQKLITLQRNLHLEQKISEQLKRLATDSEHGALAQKQQAIDDLIDSKNLSHLDEDQLAACLKARNSQLSIICGGPGSGKTTTVFQLLNILAAQYTHDALSQKKHQTQSQPRIALAACTGKAAARLNQSLEQQAKHNADIDQSQTSAFNSQSLKAKTLHRLLAYSNKRQSFRYNKTNQLAIDILIVDEVSMLDFNLLIALLEALPDHCQVVLLGDNNQLPAVEYGDLLSTLEQSPFVDKISYLQGQYRFAKESSLAQLLNLIQMPNAHQQLDQFLTTEQDATFEFINFNNTLGNQLWNDIFDAFASYSKGASDPSINVEDKIKSLYDFKVLCPFHDGEFGIDNINLKLDQHFKKLSSHKIETNAGKNKKSASDFYNGQPIMILKNNYQLNLFNGDMGVILYDQEQHKFNAHFIMSHDDGQQSTRAFNPAQLTDYKSAYAMSIHKSQGSEFKQLMLMIAPAMSHAQAQLLQRKLVYTGISRAQQKLSLCADKDTFINACASNNTSYNSLVALLNS